MKLKTCPFCGEKPTIGIGNEHSYIGGWSNDVIVSCCVQMTKSFGEGVYEKRTQQQATEEIIIQWNNRIF